MINDIDDKCKVFFEAGLPVHITRIDKSWANGLITEIGSVFILLDEFKQGRLLIFLKEIYNIESFTPEVNS